MMLSESRKNKRNVSEGDAADTQAAETVAYTVSEDENEELEKYLAYIHTVYSVFGFGLWTVCLKDDPSCIIGRCGLQPIADDNSPIGRIELGYLIDERWRGHGYAYEACSAIVRYGFEKLEIGEIYAHIPSINRPSIRLAQTLGFDKAAEDLWVLRNPA